MSEDNDFTKIGLGKFRFLTENKIEWIISDWWEITYGFPSLSIELDKRGIHSDTIKEIIIHIKEKEPIKIEDLF